MEWDIHNPDVNHPVDWNSEHTYSAYLATKNCSYYGIGLDYKVTNYTVTPATHIAFKKLNTKKGVTSLDSVNIIDLEKVKFGFGVSKGGKHTWLYSKGKVYEVHWDQIGANLYEASSLRTYPWISGAIVVPSDQTIHLSISAKLKCRS
jgi:hypothetical protein